MKIKNESNKFGLFELRANNYNYDYNEPTICDCNAIKMIIKFAYQFVGEMQMQAKVLLLLTTYMKFSPALFL